MDSFDLRKFAPPAGVKVILASGQSYLFPGDPDTDDVARMLRLEDELDSADGVELARLLEEAKCLVRKLALQTDAGQDVDAMRVNSSELVIVFALLLHGTSVAEAVAARLAPPADDSGDGDGGAAGGGSPLA